MVEQGEIFVLIPQGFLGVSQMFLGDSCWGGGGEVCVCLHVFKFHFEISSFHFY